MKPMIGISCNQRRWAGEYYLRTDYVRAITENSGAPLLIPINNEPQLLEDSLEYCDGLLLSGGGDLGPDFHQDQRQLLLKNIDEERDWFEIGLVSLALKKGRPVLAICRGLQVLNVALDGSLYHDLNSELPNAGSHQGDSIAGEASHPVYFGKNTRLAHIFGEETLVNSSHHQAIKDLGVGLKVSGVSPDGIIEAVEGEIGFVVGVQWHPERLLHIPAMNKIFKDFVEACRSNVSLSRNILAAGC